MLFDAAHTDELKAWLAAELGPICDADPEVLSDYVLALLKHDASEAELQKLLREQLEDFLAGETDKFVSATFAALSSKAYLASSSANGPSAAPTQTAATTSAATGASDAAPAEASGSSRKRGADDDDDGDNHDHAGRSSPPRQSRKLNDASAASASSQHNGAGSQSRPAIYDEPLDTRGARPRDARQGNDGRNNGRKQMCRDFHNMGYCPRGASCKYEHSINVMPGMPGQMPMGQFGMPPMMGPGPMGPMRPPPHMGQAPMMFPGAPPGYGMPPQGWAPNVRPPPAMHNGGSPGPHGANGLPHRPPAAGIEAGALAARLGSQAPPSPHALHDGSGEATDVGADASVQPVAPPHLTSVVLGAGGAAGRGGFGVRGRGRGGGPPGHFASQRRSNTTLVIENVPAEHLDLIKVNEYFKRFGTITNISIDVPGSKALVSYSQPHEAKAAHESPDVIFGNRFVKVYFQRLDEPLAAGGAAGSSAAATPPGQPQPRPAYQQPLKSNFVPGQTSNVYHARPPASAAAGALGAAAEERKKLIEDQKQKQSQLDAQLAEQKTLLAKLSDKNVSAEERKAAMASLKKLGDDIKATTDAVKAAVAAVAAAPPAAAAGTGGAKDGLDSQHWKEQREKREKEQLDRELELHSKGASPGSTTEELRKKLESLKAEAAALGLDSNGAASGAAPSGYAPRGRGRGAYVPRGARGGYGAYGWGRGGAVVNRSMRLDNRTTRIKVTELPEGADLEKVQEHLKQFGEVESISDEGADGLTVVYKTRASGEQVGLILVSPRCSPLALVARENQATNDLPWLACLPFCVSFAFLPPLSLLNVDLWLYRRCERAQRYRR
ncbi:hypothetical protein ACQY0O_001387 [Thecaphora frezii]